MPRLCDSSFNNHQTYVVIFYHTYYPCISFCNTLIFYQTHYPSTLSSKVILSYHQTYLVWLYILQDSYDQPLVKAAMVAL